MAEKGPRLRDALTVLSADGLKRGVRDERAYRSHLNENPYPPLPGVLATSRSAVGRLNRYPDDLCVDLMGAIAEHHGVTTDRVAVGAGGTAMVQQLLLAAVGPGNEVVYSWPSFERYPILSRIAGATVRPVPLSGFDQDLSAMAGAVTEKTSLIFVGNPNDPTGTALQRDRLYAFLERIPKDVLVVLDEAYRDFADPDTANGIEVSHDWPNLAVVRTFSHAYGLAGLRVGFTIAHPSVALAARKTALPLGVTTVAQEAAIASLGVHDALFVRVRSLIDERDRLRDILLDQGWTVPSSQASFLWLPLGRKCSAFVQECIAHGVIVREFPDHGVRITVREREANDLVAFIASRFSPR
ncbi:histidinol-phosphate transaminase [Nonomuraea sp. NPDC003804]|uniref:histidinol-phosphate transaminase n=1 Tax=Nonomuraea sp. NPDC003804 TaxID=3154547 RepID=UPI0033BDAE99